MHCVMVSMIYSHPHTFHSISETVQIHLYKTSKEGLRTISFKYCSLIQKHAHTHTHARAPHTHTRACTTHTHTQFKHAYTCATDSFHFLLFLENDHNEISQPTYFHPNPHQGRGMIWLLKTPAWKPKHVSHTVKLAAHLSGTILMQDRQY